MTVAVVVWAASCTALVVGAAALAPDVGARGPALSRSIGSQDDPEELVRTTFRSVEEVVPTRRGEQEASLFLPEVSGSVPGVVVVGGSGAGHRGTSSDVAQALAERGVAVLTVDKNTRGYSPLHRDYDALARDASDAVRWLGRQPGVDPARIGLWGTSEGGWVSTSVAAEDRAVAFVVMVSAPVVTPGQQLDHVVVRWLDGHHLGWVAPLAVLQLGAGDRVLGYPAYQAPLAGVDQPVLAVFGADDPTVPVAEAVSLLRRETGGRASVHVLAGAGHSVAAAGDATLARHVDLAARWILDPSAVWSVEAGVPAARIAPAAGDPSSAAAALLLAGQVGGALGALLLITRRVVAAGRRRRTARGSRTGSRRAWRRAPAR